LLPDRVPNAHAQVQSTGPKMLQPSSSQMLPLAKSVDVCGAKVSALALYCSMIPPAHAGAEPEKPAGHEVGFDAGMLGGLTGWTALGLGPGAVVPDGAAAGVAAAATCPRLHVTLAGQVWVGNGVAVNAGAGVSNATGVALLSGS
jgi:hypothetical protein